jgi:hypothetical protein
MTGNELGLDSAGGTGLERFEFVSPGEGALEYVFERESADDAQDVGFAPRPIIRSSDDSSAVEYEMTGNELGLDGEGGTGWLRIRFAPVGEAYWDYARLKATRLAINIRFDQHFNNHIIRIQSRR